MRKEAPSTRRNTTSPADGVAIRISSGCDVEPDALIAIGSLVEGEQHPERSRQAADATAATGGTRLINDFSTEAGESVFGDADIQRINLDGRMMAPVVVRDLPCGRPKPKSL